LKSLVDVPFVAESDTTQGKLQKLDMHKQMLPRTSRLWVFGIAALLVASAATFPLKAGGAEQPGGAKALQNGTRSVWDGIYTEAQAKRGQDTYTRHCEFCHQPDLRGLDCNPSLVGEAFAQEWNGRSVGDIFQRVQTTMPEGAAASLSAQEYADVISYVLNANKFPVGQIELPPDSTKLTPIVVEVNARQ